MAKHRLVFMRKEKMMDLYEIWELYFCDVFIETVVLDPNDVKRLRYIATDSNGRIVVTE